MGRDDVRAALEAMAADDDLLDMVGGGEVGALGIEGLTAAEQAMVVAAAEDWPEVAGFDLLGFGAQKVPLPPAPMAPSKPPMQGPRPKPPEPPMGPHPKPGGFTAARQYGFGW